MASESRDNKRLLSQTYTEYDPVFAPSSRTQRSDFLSKIKRKLQSFENSAYGNVKDDIPYVEMSITANGHASSDVNANIHNETAGSRRSVRRHRKYGHRCICCFIGAGLFICFIAAAVIGLILRVSDISKEEGSLDFGTSSNPSETTPASTPEPSRDTTVTKDILGQMRVIKGKYAHFHEEYRTSTSARYLAFNESLCTAVEYVFRSSADDVMQQLFASCSLLSLSAGSVMVSFHLHLSAYVYVTAAVTPSQDILYSIHHITTLFTSTMENPNLDSFTLGEFIIERDSFSLTQVMTGVLPTDETTTQATSSAATEAGPTNTTDVTVATPLCDLDKQFECGAGVLTLQHRRDYCIDLTEVCDGFVDCAEGEDEADCGVTCSNGGFRCRGPDASVLLIGSKCTWKDEQCDGIADCSDASDEANCTCQTDEFRCTNGTDIHNGDFCINGNYRCDRDPDCSDESDEEGCEYQCAEDEFKCETRTIARPPFHGYCIMAFEVCDNHVDCLDASDETQERCTTCPEGKLRCVNDTNNRCIVNSKRCDRELDCQDGSDEKNCTYECGQGEFACASGIISRWPYSGYCLYNHELCNGVPECQDESDEKGCAKHQVCGPHEWRCSNGTDKSDGDFCIPYAYKCDRYEDCSDGSDEHGQCPYICPNGHYMCVQGTITGTNGEPSRGFCLMGHTRCDNITHCNDGSDELNCDECPDDTFQCVNGTSQHTSTGHRCIPVDFKCDRDYDCSDMSDEEDCAYSCLDNQWMCKTGMISSWPFWGFCINAHERCDGFYDCEDRSDEWGCSDLACTADQFRCHNGTTVTLDSPCIDKKERCDRHYQCLDGSDEFGCVYECRENEFACVENNPGEGFCINADRVCDGVAHCSDDSDEAEELCRCDANQFRCEDGRDVKTGSPCIAKDLTCDRLSDCSDHSDENNCTYGCPDGRFMCASGTLNSTVIGKEDRGFCLPMQLTCDQTNHCVDGSDESPQTCVMKCETNQFRCLNGTDLYSSMRCIPASYRCDRFKDCTDNSDEEGCDWRCPDGKWACASGIIARWPREGYCIDISERCDGYPDCQDLSDEKQCQTADQCSHENQKAFVCENGVDVIHEDSCIPARYRCDKVPDCTDNSDEKGCNYTCDPGMIACANGTIQTEYTFRGFCLYPRHICDGTRQCRDGSDESDCDVTCENDEFKCRSKGLGERRHRCIPGKWRCDRVYDCEDESDEADCVYNCTSAQFRCETGTLARWPFHGFCIGQRDVCDSFDDCVDGSDEVGCSSSQDTCDRGKFRCRTEATERGEMCIPLHHQCDRYSDCRDQSDEKYCNYTCPAGHFMCATSSIIENMAHPSDRSQGRGYCLEAIRRCDGMSQCVDGSDEKECNGTCAGRSRMFRCTSGLNTDNITACIPDTQRCDGTPHCTDGSDELNCKPDKCEHSQFLCETKPLWYFTNAQQWCLDDSYVCDQFVDCGDFSDELKCDYLACDAGKFKCGYQNSTLGSICLPSTSVCNGEPNCFNEVDEKGCDRPCAPSNEISCHQGNAINGGHCIGINMRCDGKPDCEDSSDERFCELDESTLKDIVPHNPDR